MDFDHLEAAQARIAELERAALAHGHWCAFPTWDSERLVAAEATIARVRELLGTWCEDLESGRVEAHDWMYQLEAALAGK